MRIKPARRGAVRSCTESLEPRTLLSALPVVLRINAGGEAYTDSLARPFAPDGGFAGGTIGQSGADAAGTSDPTLFRTWQQGTAFSFHQAVANGNYCLWLEFADPIATAAGERTMDAWAEGGQVLANYDIFAEAGAYTATAKCFDVHISDGALDLSFAGVTGEAMVSAIVLIPTDVPVEAQPYPADGPYDATARNLHSQLNLRDIGQSLLLYANDNRGHYPSDFGEMFAYAGWDYTVFANPRTSTATPRGETSFVEQLAWVRGHSDYLYRPGLRTNSPPTAVLAYENPTRLAGTINVLFVDGHVESLDRADAAQRIGFDPDVPTDPAPVWPSVTGDPAVIQSQYNLYLMGQGCQLYAQDHLRVGGPFPAMLSDLYVEDEVPLSAFANPRGTTQVPDLTGTDAAAWIDAGTDYIYLGAGSSNTQSPDNILMYERPAPMDGGINFLFANGRTEFREMRWAMETLGNAHGGWARKPGTITSPIANIAGHYRTPQGVELQVSGAGVRVMEITRVTIPIAAYEWDFDYDGTTFDVDATGPSPIIPADRLRNVGERTIALRVFDTQARVSAIATTSLVVTTMPAITSISDDTGISGTDGITSDGTLLVGGVSEPLASMTIFSDGVLAGITCADAAGAWTFDYTGTKLAGGAHHFTATAVNPSGSTQISDPFTVYVDAGAPALASWKVNGGAAQRSMVRRLNVVFSEPVRVMVGAIGVRLSNGALVPNLNVMVANPSADGMNWVVTFSGMAATGGSLPDGIYDLVVAGNGVQDFAGNLSGPTQTLRFHRLLGDADGNRVVNALDYAKLKATYGRSSSDPLFSSAFDYENNGVINALDLAQFRKRYGVIFSY